MRRCVFLSHAWAPDALGRDTHARVLRLATSLRALGWRVWVDEDQLMSGHLCTTLGKGVEECDCFVVCLTHSYCEKIQRASLYPAAVSDNCLREFLLATAARKPVVPLCMEPGTDNPSRWGSVLCMHMGGHMRADATTDTPDPSTLHRTLCGIFSGGPLRGVLGPRRRAVRKV